MEDNLWAPAKELRSIIQEQYGVPNCNRCSERHGCVSYQILKKMEKEAGEPQGWCEACTSYRAEEE